MNTYAEVTTGSLPQGSAGKSTGGSEWLAGFFGVVLEPRTYLNLLYILLAFPLGVAYFVHLTVGFSVGLGLAIIWVGLPILALMILTVYGLAGLERQLAVHLLGVAVGPLRQKPESEESAWIWLKAVFSAPGTWKGLIFLALKFPLGLATWIPTIVLLAVSVALVFAPLIHLLGGEVSFGYWYANSWLDVFLCSIAGFFAVLISLHVVNGMGFVWAALSQALLGGGAPGETVRSADFEEPAGS